MEYWGLRFRSLGMTPGCAGRASEECAVPRTPTGWYIHEVRFLLTVGTANPPSPSSPVELPRIGERPRVRGGKWLWSVKEGHAVQLRGTSLVSVTFVSAAQEKWVALSIAAFSAMAPDKKTHDAKVCSVLLPIYAASTFQAMDSFKGYVRRGKLCSNE